MSGTVDPSQLDVIVGGRRLSGYAPGTFITITPEGPGFTDVAGADGAVARLRSSDRRATLEVTLLQTSESNQVLSDLYQADRNAVNGAGVIALRVIDRAGRSVFEAARAWISEEPTVTYSDTVENRVWRIRMERHQPNHGGNDF